MVSVPKCLEALVTNFAVGSSVNEEHDEEHEVAGNAACLGKLNIEGSLCTNLCRGKVRVSLVGSLVGGGLTGELDVVEVDIVSSCVYDRPKCHRVGDLTVKPNVFVCRKESD